MEAIHIKKAIAGALQNGNWMAYNELSLIQNHEFYFFLLRSDAKEFCRNNISDRDSWNITYVKSPKRFLKAANNHLNIPNYQFLKYYKMNEQNANC